jgi:hypothetical protein
MTGLHQGDRLGPLLFAVGLHPLVLRIQEEVPGLLIYAWYLDDGHLVGNPTNILRAFNIKDLAPTIGLRLNLQKTIFWRDRACHDRPPPGFDPVSLGIPECLLDGLVILGAPAGCATFCQETVASQVRKVTTHLESLSTLEDPQIQYALLQSCFG